MPELTLLVIVTEVPSQITPLGIELIIGWDGIGGAALITAVVAPLTQPLAFCVVTL